MTGKEVSQQSQGVEGQGFRPPEDGSWVPRDRANEMVDQAVARTKAEISQDLGRLQGQVETLTQTQQSQQTQKPVYTREQLNAFVADGKMSEAQAAGILDQQNEERTQQLIENTVTTALSTHQRTQVVADGISSYAALVPEVLAPGSEERQKVERQYNYLVSLGQPATKATELVALQTTYGPIESLRARTQSDTGDEFETHREGAGGGYGPDSGSTGRQPKSDGKITLTKDERAYYDDLINKGVYRDMDQVIEEMKHADSRLRSRHGAAA